MAGDKGDAAFLWDMLDSARSVVELTAGMNFHQYQQDRRTRRAVEREVEIIGEAARKVSAEFQQAHPDVPWRKIIAQRHKLAHEYGEIQDVILWRVVTIHVPELMEQLKILTPPPPQSPPLSEEP
jgi:uncharacterized protein with HEPN domain